MSAGLQQLSRDELIELVVMLQGQVAELQRRLGMDSSNSSRPPSSDNPYTKPVPKQSAMRGKSGRRQGKQRGTPGVTRGQVLEPDEIIVVDPDCCNDCGASLCGMPVFAVRKRQVVEVVPPPPPKVTEYQVVSRACGCCHATTAGLAPVWAKGRMQWGPGVLARAVWAAIGHHLPYGRAKQVLATLSGVDVSTGVLVNARRKAADLLEPFAQHVRALLHRAGLLHVDETTARAAGGLTYVHVACNDDYTMMHVGGRTNGDIDAGGILPDYAGILVRDGYAGYTHFVAAQHAWCGAHLLRDLKAAHDADPAGQHAIACLADTLTLMLDETGKARACGLGQVPDERIAWWHSAYNGAIAAIRHDNQHAKTVAAQRALTLADRFDTHRDMILRFLHDLAVPFTNNSAERAVRGVKVKQRASACWRTLTGLADFAIIWSYLSTAGKHGLDHLDALTQLFTTGPWLPPDPNPAI